MARKLVSIQVVHDVQPIEGADQIEVVSVLGWKAVVRKGTFQRLDRCVFFEVDSLLDPSNPVFDFMEKSKYRVKTIKLRGQISQGLAMPLDILPEWARDMETGYDCQEITKTLKYEPPGANESSIKTAGNFPAYVPKTDETRIQSSSNVLEELRGEKMYYSIKVDGTSSTFSILDGEVNVCSRTRAVKDEGDNPYWRMAHKYNIIDILQAEGDIAIQGEIAGFWKLNRSSPIQKNRLGLGDTDLFVFDVYKIKENRYYGYQELIDFCDKYGLKTVPMGDVNFELNHTQEELLAMAEGEYPNGHPREGLVFRTMEPMYCKALKGRASFKVINNTFLLKGGD